MTELKSNAEWRQWGKDDPLWGVASWIDKQKNGSSPWTEEEFYALGESDWQDFLRRWIDYGLTTRSCIEIGCGAGRITKQLAKSFDRVHAVDVSGHMIKLARRAVNGSARVDFSLIDGVHLPYGNCAATAIFSTHVLQHLDSVEVGFSYFRELFRVLDFGGTMMIHLPLYQLPEHIGQFGVLMQFLYTCYRRLDDIRSDRKRRIGAKNMRLTPYPIRPLNVFLSDLGFRNVEFRIFSLKSNGDPHPFVFATK